MKLSTIIPHEAWQSSHLSHASTRRMAVCCGVAAMQYVADMRKIAVWCTGAVWCSVVQCVVVESSGCPASLCLSLPDARIAVCCSVVHCSALWWSDRLVSHSLRLSLFKSAAVCAASCSVHQRAAVCNSVL